MVDPKTGEYDELPHIGPGNIESFSGRLLNNVNNVAEDKLISGKFHFNAGDIIYGKINPQLGKYVYASYEGLASADTYVLNAKNGINQKFLYTMLQTRDFYKYSVSVSMRTGMPKINRDELNMYNFNAPSEEEQIKIGTFFQTLDQTIALHQRELKKDVLMN
ncbi:restriction endonuclease subunit S [Sporolactobacillus sp. STSJ-5]|uniref:restriction endonuclease subunit S n=1 Tax=Sporolactobacillus sp. STSJ-5 TaxID=2965076 RepID=UPI0021028477|nr:restriction endonuclease subunit S [Sporolactobacillus sp. STSJ-5]MCQ2011302.1 restriction endonuclease subunit S [Sporolactobacillus sp. STSJ-5]